MEKRAYGSIQTNGAQQHNRRRLVALHEILFSLNIACAFGDAMLVYLSKSLRLFTPPNDSMYYFLRAAFRIDDLLRLPSRNPVSTAQSPENFHFE
jgi:hypothetical protein